MVLPVDPVCLGQFARSENVVVREIAGETLAIPVRGNVGDLASIYSFNQTGTAIWKSLDSPKSFNEIVDVVTQEYDVSQVEAAEHVRIFLEEMCVAGLIQCGNEVAGEKPAVHSEK